MYIYPLPSPSFKVSSKFFFRRECSPHEHVVIWREIRVDKKGREGRGGMCGRMTNLGTNFVRGVEEVVLEKGLSRVVAL